MVLLYHQHDCGTGHADVKPGSLLHERRKRTARQQTAGVVPHFKGYQRVLQPKAGAAEVNGEKLGTRIIPQFPVAVQPSSVHASSLHPASADTKATSGRMLSE